MENIGMRQMYRKESRQQDLMVSHLNKTTGLFALKPNLATPHVRHATLSYSCQTHDFLPSLATSVASNLITIKVVACHTFGTESVAWVGINQTGPTPSKEKENKGNCS